MLITGRFQSRGILPVNIGMYHYYMVRYNGKDMLSKVTFLEEDYIGFTYYGEKDTSQRSQFKIDKSLMNTASNKPMKILFLSEHNNMFEVKINRNNWRSIERCVSNSYTSIISCETDSSILNDFTIIKEDIDLVTYSDIYESGNDKISISDLIQFLVRTSALIELEGWTFKIHNINKTYISLEGRNKTLSIEEFISLLKLKVIKILPQNISDE